MRLAIGASRGRILRQFITESLVLALIGGVLGAVLAVGVRRRAARVRVAARAGRVPTVAAFGGSMVPRLHEIAVDGRLLGLAMGLAAITALLVGAMPAFRMSRVDHAQVMNYRGAGGQGGARRADTRVRSVLVVAQMMVGDDAPRRRGSADQLLHAARARRPRLECVGAADVLPRHAAGLFDARAKPR